MCTYSLVPITLAPATKQGAFIGIRSTTLLRLLIRYYYPKCALLHARLKKLYFFQIVKERKLHLSKAQALDKCSNKNSMNGGG